MNQDLKKLTKIDIEKAIKSYLNARKSSEEMRLWFKKYRTKESVTQFLLWQEELLPAKAIVKCALSEKDLDIFPLFPEQAIRQLNKLNFETWDTNLDGEYDEATALVYKSARRLARPGHQKFRRNAMKIWENRCAVSRCNVDAALEAAHIIPHADEGNMNAKNSILLRADLHRLFDMNLMAINPNTMLVNFKEEARSYYKNMAGKKVKLPTKGGPSAKNFNERWKQFKAK